MNCGWTSKPLLVDQATIIITSTMKIATVGKPTELSPVETLRFEVHGFTKLKEKKGKRVKLPSLSAHGYDWTIDLYPRGDNKARDGQVSCHLRLTDENLTEQDAIEAKFAVKFGVRAAANICKTATIDTFSKQQRSWGCSNCVKRELLLNKDSEMLLPNGTLIVDVELQVYVEKRVVWYPTTPIQNGDTQMLVDLLETGRYSDVTFQVGQQDFRLHRFVLENRALALFQMIEHPDQTITLEEEDVDAAMFQIIVRNIYTSDWPAAVLVDADVATTILTLANRFGCINLKHYVESVMVESFLDQDSAADMLLLGDSHTCAQLKEAAVKIFKNQADAVMNTEGWKRVKESSALVAELLSVVATTTQPSARTGTTNDDHPDGQCVAELRNQLLKRGLDVDGSREMLVKRLKAE
jgi:BTB/POZ domain/MATH domain